MKFGNKVKVVGSGEETQGNLNQESENLIILKFENCKLKGLNLNFFGFINHLEFISNHMVCRSIYSYAF